MYMYITLYPYLYVFLHYPNDTNVTCPHLSTLTPAKAHTGADQAPRYLAVNIKERKADTMSYVFYVCAMCFRVFVVCKMGYSLCNHSRRDVGCIDSVWWISIRSSIMSFIGVTGAASLSSFLQIRRFSMNNSLSIMGL